MDPSTLRTQLRDDFRRQFRGELLLDPASRALYSTDASLFQIDPLGVAVPRDEADVAFLLRYAHERSIPVVPRGAGTGIAGESLSHGLVVDFSVCFREILEVGDDWVRVQPGVVLDQLNNYLRRIGRRFAPDPGNSHSCTIGGMIATNASGARAAIHGRTRDHVLAMRVVWDDGTADTVGVDCGAATDRTRTIETAVRELVQSNAELIDACHRRLRFDRCGYALYDALRNTGRELLPLLVGSEGTLAFTAEAKLRTVPLPGGRSAVLFGFPSLDAALQAGLQLRETGPAACELLDRRVLSLARMQALDVASAISPDVEAALLVEYECESPAAAEDAVQSLLSPLHEVQRSAILTVPAFDSSDADELLTIRTVALPALHALGKGRRPLALAEDVGLAPDNMVEFVGRANAILKQFDISTSYLIHVATGQVQLRPFLDPDDPADAARLWPLAEELHSLAIDLGGTVSAQHGTGIARTPWVARQYAPLFPVFQELKRVFDPRNILNPGKIVGPDPSRPAWPLRSRSRSKPSPAIANGERPAASTPDKRQTPLLLWATDEIKSAVSACNGCGACRTEAPAQRMCPTARATHTERATPRAKANLFRSIADGSLSDATEDELRSVADLCINCKMCAIECPGRANIPKLMLEAKAANHAAQGWRRSAWFLARIEGLASLGSKFALTSNFLLRRPTVRWGLERIFGLARRRVLPAFAFRTFLGRARRRRLTRRPASGPGVTYFVDTFANLFDPGIGEATVAVLRHNGIPVYVPPRQRGCGSMALAQGDSDVARERLMYNVRHLADCARNGDTIICSEPTAALFFRLDALGLIDDADVKLVAERTVELTAYLWSLHEEGRLRTDFQPLHFRIGHHVPCHIKALGSGVFGPALLSLIPGLGVDKIDVSCSGMAGTYGLNAKNLSISLAAGRPMLDELSRPDRSYGSSECSACRMQMQEGTGKRALHPVQYMALAYGLIPSLADRLRQPVKGRVSS